MSVTHLRLISPDTLGYRGLDPRTLDDLAKRFQNAKPFPYVHIRDFLKIPFADILWQFPIPEWGGWLRCADLYQRNKMYYSDIDGILPSLRALIQDLSSPAFLQFLERVTGIEAILPDPYLEGGGLHCSGPGDILTPHTDFHVYQRLHLFRRLNVLLYLNPEWKQEYGGCLELYEKGSKTAAVTIVPEWGSCVIFKTDDDSVHGFAQPILGNRWRRSIALYYYTSSEAAGFSGDLETHWNAYAMVSGQAQLRLQLYKRLMLCSRFFSRLAHKAYPNRGFESVPKFDQVRGKDAESHSS